MIPLNTRLVRGDQRRLQDIFDKLDGKNRDTLIAFAEFLAAQAPVDEGAVQKAPEQPKTIQRPEVESVVAAIRRLSTTYFMLDRKNMLDDTASLMSTHIMQGRPAADVIDELESVFKTHYDRYLDDWRK